MKYIYQILVLAKKIKALPFLGLPKGHAQEKLFPSLFIEPYKRLCTKILAGFIIMGFNACSESPQRSRPTGASAPIKQATVTLSANKAARGEQLQIKVEVSPPPLLLKLRADSLLFTGTGQTLSFSTQHLPTGKQTLRLEVQLADSSWEQHDLRLKILAAAAPQTYTYQLQTRHTHDTEAYTQGLLLHEGMLYEGTGQKGRSYLQKRKWPSNEVLHTVHLPEKFFGEGIALQDHKLYQLTWQGHLGFIYDKENLSKVGEFQYHTEGWGLTSWNEYLVMSDGSEQLYFYKTEPWQHSHTLQVYDHQGPVSNINELEAVEGRIYANQYETEVILIIDPQSGVLIGKLDASALFDKKAYTQATGKKVDVMNGIAYDAASQHLLLTGKLWPYVYEIRVFSPSSRRK